MEKGCFAHLTEREFLGHIASEVSRAKVWAGKCNISRRDEAARRACELIDGVLAVSLSLVTRDDLEGWKVRMASTDIDEGLLADVEARLMIILGGDRK